MTTRWISLTLLLAAMATGDACADGIKSESTALRLSMLGTGLPLGTGVLVAGDAGAWIFLGGAVLGPSLGHFYAERPGRALIGVGIRSAAIVGLAAAIGSSWEDESGGAAALGIGCLMVGTASIITDIAEAPRSARKHNAGVGERRFSVGPWKNGVRASLEF